MQGLLGETILDRMQDIKGGENNANNRHMQRTVLCGGFTHVNLVMSLPSTRVRSLHHNTYQNN